MTLNRIVDEKDEGRKIKYYVRGEMGVSYGQLSSIKMLGGLRVNGEIVHANHILHTGDLVEVVLDERSTSIVEPAEGPVNVIYEDEHLLVIDKSAPLACQSSSRNPEPALENRLMARYGAAFVFRPLNRLDKGTSGLLCAAKNAHVTQLLQKTLHTEQYVREYLAVVEGEMTGEGVIDLPIAKVDEASVRRVVDPERGREAVTHWKGVSTGNGRSLVRLRLETGRTHQIRVHLSHLGHPIAGDFLYGTELPELPQRFALHSARIRFEHPMTGKIIDLESPLPEELRALLNDAETEKG